MKSGDTYSIFLERALTALAITPEQWHEATERIALQVRRTKRVMRVRWRVAFVLRELYGLSFPEVGQVLGMTHGSVISLLKRGWNYGAVSTRPTTVGEPEPQISGGDEVPDLRCAEQRGHGLPDDFGGDRDPAPSRVLELSGAVDDVRGDREDDGGYSGLARGGWGGVEPGCGFDAMAW